MKYIYKEEGKESLEGGEKEKESLRERV